MAPIPAVAPPDIPVDCQTVAGWLQSGISSECEACLGLVGLDGRNSPCRGARDAYVNACAACTQCRDADCKCERSCDTTA